MNEYGSCEYRWKSYFFDECGRAWVGYGETHQVQILMNENLRERPRGRIASIRFGDPDVVLHCF